MAETFALTVEPRGPDSGKAGRRLRRQGLLPGVVYGYNLQTPQAVQFDQRMFERLYHRAGNVHLVDLRIGAAGAPTQALIHNVTRDPMTHTLTHVDFLAVNPRLETTSRVPIVAAGEAPAVSDGTGVLLHVMDALEVRSLPADTPESIQADVSSLTEVGSTLYVRDLAVPPNVTVLADPEEIVLRIAHVRVTREEAAATEAAETEAAATGEEGAPGSAAATGSEGTST